MVSRDSTSSNLVPRLFEIAFFLLRKFLSDWQIKKAIGTDSIFELIRWGSCARAMY